MKNRFLLGAGVALAVALGGVQAHAQFGNLNLFGPYPPGVFYLGPEGGWTQLSSNTRSGSVTFRFPDGRLRTHTFSETTSFNSGFNAGVRGGYEWGPWRFEEEWSYRNNNLSNFSGSITGPLGIRTHSFAGNGSVFQGSVHSNSIMTNAIYDFTFGWPITPHIGAGVGATNVNVGISRNDNARLPGVLRTTGFGSLDGHQWNFAYQAIAGIRYDVSPLVSVDFDYHYLATPNFTFTSSCPFIEEGFRCAGRQFSINQNYRTQNLIASITMKFGAPPVVPPPPPPAPPPPPVHQVYLVFFDWDRYNITPEGMQILEAAAAHWKAGGAVQIQVTGYTDLSGPAGYNQRLSERRANAVAVALERLGIPRSDMVVAGRGMNDPRVPTALGVREPQNRRVEIVFP
jgi:outer membrane protein OmpA-like peptidoglycan-associated protein